MPPLALFEGSGLGGPQILAITLIALFLLAVIWGIGFAWGRSKRDKKPYCPKCNRELKQPESATVWAFGGARLF
jgi:hypothetical protein